MKCLDLSKECVKVLRVHISKDIIQEPYVISLISDMMKTFKLIKIFVTRLKKYL